MSRAQTLALTFIGFVVVVGGIFLLISLLQGDETGRTNDRNTAPNNASSVARDGTFPLG